MENEEIKKDESVEMTITETRVQGLECLGRNSMTEKAIFTNITDKKKLFNLDNGANITLLNDCENEIIRVKGILIKTFRKMKLVDVVDKETGEILVDETGENLKQEIPEIKMSTILVDDNDKAYVTGSKMFAIQLSNYLQDFGRNELESENGLEIKIVKVKMSDSNNKKLAFELV